MSAMVSWITSVSIVCSTVCSGTVHEFTWIWNNYRTLFTSTFFRTIRHCSSWWLGNERTINNSLNDTISLTHICYRASQCVTMIKTPCATRTTEVMNNCLRGSLLLQSPWRWQCFIHGNIDCLCRHGVQTLFSLTTLWEGSSVTGSSPHKGQVMQSVYIFIVVILYKLLNKQRNAYESSWNLLNI